MKRKRIQILTVFLCTGLALACNLARQAGPSVTQQGAASGGLPEFTPTAEVHLTETATPIEVIWPPTVDEILADCPTAQEITEIDSKIKMSFEADPTAGVLVCAAAAGSADLTREQKNAYNAVRIMKHLTFDAPLPWTDQSLYDWFTGTIQGIRYRSDITSHSCCGTPPTVNIKAELHAFYSDRWTAVGKLMTLYIHEARHTYMAHQCQWRDNTIAELGAYGVEARLNEWLAYHIDPDFLAMLAPGPTNDYREAARHEFYALQTTNFCLDPTPNGPPPALAASASADTPAWTARMIQASQSGVPVPVLLSPAPDATVPSRGAVFTWESVEFPGGVTYGIEVDALFSFGKEWEYWQARTDSSGLAGTSYTIPISFDGSYHKMGRWRVWAISPTAGAGPKSEWQYFTIKD